LTEGTLAIARLAKEAAEEVKAQDIVILDMRRVTLVTDYFVIATGTSRPQIQAMADRIKEKVEGAGTKLLHSEGLANAKWVLMDFGAVVVHIFGRVERDFYHLERLWGDAPVIEGGERRNEGHNEGRVLTMPDS